MTELARKEEPGETPEEQLNPYAAPKATVVTEAGPRARLKLASRGERFAAALVDNLVYLPCLLPLFLGNGFRAFIDPRYEELPNAAGWAGIGLAFLIGLAIFGVQIYLLVTEGATLGKRVMRIRIVTVDGEPVGALQILLLRTVLPGLAGFMCSIFSLIDALFIFGEQRRCVHDLMAGTVVVSR
ncbi:MAG: RDD family protein [Planctomycetota bacterium]|nr:RDD family protein [Planctomycetota bacterium]